MGIGPSARSFNGASKLFLLGGVGGRFGVAAIDNQAGHRRWW
jgi:hypothetical protein